MSATVQQFVDSFDKLSDADKHEVSIEILRRITSADENDLPEQTLVTAADELFRTLDEEEASNAPR